MEISSPIMHLCVKESLGNHKPKLPISDIPASDVRKRIASIWATQRFGMLQNGGIGHSPSRKRNSWMYTLLGKCVHGSFLPTQNRLMNLLHVRNLIIMTRWRLFKQHKRWQTKVSQMKIWTCSKRRSGNFWL